MESCPDLHFDTIAGDGQAGYGPLILALLGCPIFGTRITVSNSKKMGNRSHELKWMILMLSL